MELFFFPFIFPYIYNLQPILQNYMNVLIFKLMQKYFFQVVDLFRKLNKLYHPWTFEKNIVFFRKETLFLCTKMNRSRTINGRNDKSRTRTSLNTEERLFCGTGVKLKCCAVHCYLSLKARPCLFWKYVTVKF